MNRLLHDNAVELSEESPRSALALSPGHLEIMGRAAPTGAPAAELAKPAQVAGVGSCLGTLGELFQGPIRWDGELEIAIASLPFSGRSRCRYELGATQGASDGLEGRPKTARAVALLLAQHGLRLPSGRFRFSSDLEVGKGMASSTADIVAAVRCVGTVVGRRFRAREIMDVLRPVERSDSVFLREGALYLSERHEVVVRFGRTLGYTAAYLVEPAAVDTEAMRECLLEHYRRSLPAYRAALESFISGAVQRDPYRVAAAATESARLSQRCLPKRCFVAMRSAMQALGADGLFVAHTGSVVGYLYVRPPPSERCAELEAFFVGLGEQVRFARVGWGDV
jgi:uncharacterized protein involved in propanediol utilization